MPVTINGTTGISSDGGYTGDGVSFADGTPSNTLVTTTGGNVGIGTSSPGQKLDVNGNVKATGLGAAINTGVNFAGFGDNNSRILANSGDGYMYYYGYSGHIFRDSNTNAERARIDSSGNLLVNTTSSYGGKFAVLIPSGAAGGVFRVSTNGDYALAFQNSSGTTVGNVTVNSASTAYNTSSDYRLKHDISPMTGALARVTALKPVTYKWNVDNSDGEGFIAHELAEVVPQCVTGEKDAVDADGNPIYQGIDTSFLVATLTAAIQELKAELDSVKAELATLKGAQA